MSKSQFFSPFTSRNFEREILNRFRNLAVILPSECQISRETWNQNTVLCLNFEHCPNHIEIIKEDVSMLSSIVKKLSLANSIIFRQGNQLKAWRKCS